MLDQIGRDQFIGKGGIAFPPYLGAKTAGDFFVAFNRHSPLSQFVQWVN
jgi:hypothetical protein